MSECTSVVRTVIEVSRWDGFGLVEEGDAGKAGRLPWVGTVGTRFAAWCALNERTYEWLVD